VVLVPLSLKPWISTFVGTSAVARAIGPVTSVPTFIFADYFSGPGRAIDLVFVCVSVCPQGRIMVPPGPEA